jgi:uncharacterized protein YodC (DUF2158 family)
MAYLPGELVQLKSGGPLMTVVKVEDKCITCMWYAQEQSEFRTQVFEQAWLDEVDIEDDDEE